MDVRLHEVGRFTLNIEKKHFDDSMWAKQVIDYVVNRQNEDGGYTFAQGIESNAQDTYYGLAILNLLNAPYPKIRQTIEWLHNFAPDNIYSHYYIAKALILCDEKPDKKLQEFLRSLEPSKGVLGAVDVYVEVASEFLFIFMVTELLNVAQIAADIDRQNAISWLQHHKNRDGGFGAHGDSNINATYHAIASLSNLGYPVKSLKETLRYVSSCENPSGGFTMIPTGLNPYMEHIYYGLATLDLLGEHAKYTEKTRMFIMRCQNANGGFARSDLGISTFENTFYALSALRIINREQT